MLSLLLVLPAAAFSPTAGVYAGYGHRFEPDLYAGGGLLLMGRIGVELPKMDIEIALGRQTGTITDHEWPWYFVDPRIEVLWHPEHRDRFDFFVGGGLGYRYARIDDGTQSKSKVEDELFITGDPIMDVFVSAGGGVTAQIWGPIHARADLRATVAIGPMPTGHAFVGSEAVLGVEYRGEGPPDKDRDGVPDKKDRCPTEVEDIDWVEDADGCPDPDNDADGVPDAADQCGIAEDHDGFQDEDGCPDSNNDSDNLPDTDDKCPNDAETDNDYEDQDGCPDQLPNDLDRVTNQPLPGMEFTGETWTPASVAALDGAVAVLLKYPDVAIEAECYTDDDGDLARLRVRSEVRCDAVIAYFVAHGVPAARLHRAGNGATMAIAPNTTPEGRAKNNRIVLLRMP